VADRDDAGQLFAALGDGADLLVDCICYTAADATRLLPLVAHASSTVMISSKAVYVDDAGNHSNSATAPRFDDPIRESQPTVAPNDEDHTTRGGYGGNKVAAEHILLDSGRPVTVLRPSKIHGAWAPQPREWVFVKRALDRRAAVLLAHQGVGVDHPTAAANIAALIEVVAGAPGRRILNSADPDAPNALEISRTIATQLGHEWIEVLLDDGADPSLGRHPWDTPHPIVLDMTAAVEMGYTPAGDYATTVVDEIDWLVAAARGGAGAESLPALDDPFFGPMLDYAAEDLYLSTRR
jgi:nucleoside-diphosphate-sugar epimerase